MNMISNGELSDPQCDSVNSGLTLVRLLFSCLFRNLLDANVPNVISTLLHYIIHCDVIAVVCEKFITWVISTEYEGKHGINAKYARNINSCTNNLCSKYMNNTLDRDKL